MEKALNEINNEKFRELKFIEEEMVKNIKSEIYFNKIERRIFHFDAKEPVIRPLFY